MNEALLNMIANSGIEKIDPSSMAAGLFNTMLPIIKGFIPAEYGKKTIAGLIISIIQYVEPKIRKFSEYIIYDTNTGNCDSIFTFCLGMCEEIEKLKENPEDYNKLIIILKLYSENLILKKINLKIAGINVTETIKNCSAKGIPYNEIDQFIEIILFSIDSILSRSILDLDINKIYEFMSEGKQQFPPGPI